MEVHISKVDSSIIEKFVYDYDTKEMIITFAGNNEYKYKDVGESVFIGFLNAESKGRYINQIKGDFEFEKLEKEI